MAFCEYYTSQYPYYLELPWVLSALDGKRIGNYEGAVAKAIGTVANPAVETIANNSEVREEYIKITIDSNPRIILLAGPAKAIFPSLELEGYPDIKPRGISNFLDLVDANTSTPSLNIIFITFFLGKKVWEKT